MTTIDSRIFLVFHILTAIALYAPSGSWASEPTPPAPDKRSPDEWQSPRAKLIDGNAAFALDLYHRLSAKEGNLLFSPYSISQALAMTYAGARGQTEQQMANVLHLEKQIWVHGAFKAVDEQLRASKHARAGGKGFNFSIANAVWGQKGDVFLEAFQKLLRENYGAGLREVDFKHSPALARATINDWVARQTKNKIKDLLPNDAIRKNTSLILTNAIYFNAVWTNPFRQESTQDEDFHLNDGAVIRVPMMSQREELRYAKRDGLEAVRLSYDGGGFAMIVLLPESGQFKEFQEKLSARRLSAILNGMKEEDVDLTMPKFKYESEFSLGDTLASMGMPDAFDSQLADFSGISGKRDMWIDQVIHKAFVRVDEKGTEAAAATAVVTAKATAIRPSKPPIMLKVDRPFVYLIFEEKTGTILFLGRVLDPRK